MAKKDIDYDAILRRFVEKERSRFAILEPFTVDGWTAATDGWKLCAIKAGVFKASYNTENVPNIAAIWPDEQLTEKRIISLDKLIHWPYENGEPPVKPTRPEPRYKPCKTCAGHGRCSCACSDGHGCRKCSGTGKVETRQYLLEKKQYELDYERFQRLNRGERYCRLFDVVFDYDHLRTIREAARALHSRQLTIRALSPSGVFVAETPKARFALMPARPRPDLEIAALEV